MDMSRFLEIQAQLREQALARSVGLRKLFAGFDVRSTAAAAGGMLTLPELQGNAVRMEAIAHFAVSASKGSKIPKDRDAAKWFREAGKAFGTMEDPAEDVFVARAMYGGRNYRVLGGTAEASSYHLQRMLDVLSEMPDVGGFGSLKGSCEALLRISDALCQRAGLRAYQEGEANGHETYPASKLPTLKTLGRRVTFDRDELEALDVHLEALHLFELPQGEKDVSIGLEGNTKLERRPLLRFEDAIVVALPSAVGLAIRFAIVALCRATGNEKVLRSNLLATEIDVLSDLPSIHRMDIPHSSVEGEAKVLSASPVEFQPGYWFQVVVVSDDFEAFDESGFYGPSPNGEAISRELEDVLHSTAATYRDKEGFKLALSLVVICGCGRSIEFGFNSPDQWIVETISAYDIQVLGWRGDFDIPELVKFLLAENHAMHLGFPLMAVNGLLARAGFAFENDGHVLPHERMPDGLEAATLLVPTNAHLKLRTQHYHRLDWRTLVDAQGMPRMVYARGTDQDRRSAGGGLYLSFEDSREGRLRTVWLSGSTKWFAETLSVSDDNANLYTAFEMQMTWLERIAPLLDRHATMLPDVLTWELVVPYVLPQREVIKVPSEADILASIKGECDVVKRLVTTTLDETFFQGLSNEENLSERSLVSVFLEQVAKLTLSSAFSPKELLEEIVPTRRARQLHAFAAQDLRDYVRESVKKPVVQISRFDNAAIRLGLGWHDGSRRSGVIKGRSECTDTLNHITKSAEEAFRKALSVFERGSVIERALENHEASILDKRQWDRTSGSLMDISADPARTKERIFDHTARANATAMACRIIMEAAICECPVGSGYQLADNDLSSLMAQAMMIHFLGGYSDAIRYEGMKPEIRITPAGDVHIDTDFFDAVVTPVGRSFAGLHLERNIRDYSGLLREPGLAPSDITEIVEPEFLVAWAAELGISLWDVRSGLEALENHLYELGRAWVAIPRGGLLELLGRSIPSPEAFLAALELIPRDRWTDIPPPFEDQDRQPWRFRRRLSVVRRPLISAEVGDTSDVYVAPGLVRDAFGFMIHSFYHGEIDIGSLGSKQMRDWREHVVARSSAQFEERVVRRLESLGWNAKRGVKFTTVLNRRLPKDPGDIDVLAWHPDGRIVLLECKDLQFAKTPSEIAKQLYKFRGVPDERGRPDLLGKHLNRVALAAEHSEEFRKHLKLDRVKVEGGLVFANPVPMTFAAARIGREVPLMIFRDLEKHFA